MTTVCLAMIVKNEEQVIERGIRSVRGLIDRWVICDTGSTDATRERALHALEDIPGEWHERPWIDFAHNRTELMELARGKADYLLLLDADETMTWPADLKERLAADAYRVWIDAGGTVWTQPRLVRSSLPWRYLGAAMEFLEFPEGRVAELLEDSVIELHADGPRRPKVERNIHLLERDHERDPEDPRPVFYLGHAYHELYLVTEPRDIEHARRAVEFFERRVAQGGGWDLEIYDSLYNIGVLCADALDDWAAAMNAFIDAWEHRSHRMEPLYQLATRLRGRGAYNAAYAFAREVRRNRPTPDELMIEQWIYDYGLEFEYAVLAGHVGDFAESMASLDRLLDNERLPSSWRSDVEGAKKTVLEAMRTSLAPDNIDGEDATLVAVHLEDLESLERPWGVTWVLPSGDAGAVSIPHLLDRAGAAIRLAMDRLPDSRIAGASAPEP